MRSDGKSVPIDGSVVVVVVVVVNVVSFVVATVDPSDGVCP
jgi:hypothetical protein